MSKVSRTDAIVTRVCRAFPERAAPDYGRIDAAFAALPDHEAELFDGAADLWSAVWARRDPDGFRFSADSDR